MSAPAYWDYLKLDRLLDLQSGLEEDEESLAPDELHFIVVHQVFELWFKLMLREVRLARDHLSAPRVPEERLITALQAESFSIISAFAITIPVLVEGRPIFERLMENTVFPLQRGVASVKVMLGKGIP